MNETFIKKLKELLNHYENTSCSSKCHECVLNQKVIEIGDYKYNVCDLLKEIWYTLGKENKRENKFIRGDKECPR